MMMTTITSCRRRMFHWEKYRLSDPRCIFVIVCVVVLLCVQQFHHQLLFTTTYTITTTTQGSTNSVFMDAPNIQPSWMDHGHNHNSSTNIKTTSKLNNNNNNMTVVKFYILNVPQITTWLLQNYTEQASIYYNNKALNEDSAEVWLHRGFEQMTHEQGHTNNPKEADIFLLPGYCHFHYEILKQQEQEQHNSSHSNNNKKKNRRRNTININHQSWIQQYYINQILDTTKPHLLLIPTTNPTRSQQIGIKQLVKSLQDKLGSQNLWSVGFERNKFWQRVPPEQIIPIPYVIRPTTTATTTTTTMTLTEQHNTAEGTGINNNFIFYAGDGRRHAREWAGCHREELIASFLQIGDFDAGVGSSSNDRIKKNNDTTTTTTTTTTSTLTTKNDNIDKHHDWGVDVRIVTKTNRLNQSEYNHRMATSDYCLILCGDTPTSRSLTSAMVSGCIPLRIGSRLRGLCEPPCHTGYGWSVTGIDYPHLPYNDKLDWNIFPEMKEIDFMNVSNNNGNSGRGRQALQDLFQRTTTSHKLQLRSIMKQVQRGWIYGWGDPVNSTEFGDAALYIWDSFLYQLQQQQKQQ